MAFVPATNVLEVALEGQYPNGQRVVNVLHFLRNLAWTLEALLDFLDALQTAWDANVRALVSNQVSLTRIAGRDLTTQEGIVGEVNIPQPHSGSVSSPAMAAHTTLAIKSFSGFAGRSRRGRSYWWGLSEGQVAGDFIVTPAVAVSIINAWVAMIEATETATATEHVIVSKISEGALRSSALVSQVIGYSLEDFRVDTQRRRLVGEGD